MNKKFEIIMNLIIVIFVITLILILSLFFLFLAVNTFVNSNPSPGILVSS